ncbi:MAG TPA: ABC transporter ATP-binding protein [Homoserinimonas sp.]|nr:ABC transporter ATP-binding protein [Homoserinimonas sp.]
MTLAIHTRQLAKHYGKHPALHGLDISVEEGTVFGVIGPNGAGKTTTMRLLLDIIRPSSGSAQVLGQDPRRAGSAIRRDIGFLPGELRLEGRVTGRQLLRHYAHISGPVAPGAIDALAERLGLDLGRQVRTLSKGNKQKLGLVQAFMHQPKLLVLDEPTSGLDPLVQQEFLAMIREARNNGQTVFLSSHVLSEIQQAADTVAILRAGRVITVSDVNSLRLTAIRHVRLGVTGTTAQVVHDTVAAVPGVSELTVTNGDDARVTATIEGDIDPFVKAASRFQVTDLVVQEPDLEESVLRLYNIAPEESTDEQ